MKNIQIILNAVLSKNIVEYIIVDKDFKVINASEGTAQYTGSLPSKGDDIFIYLPELVGSESVMEEIMTDPSTCFALESVYKNDFYVNITVEHFDDKTVLILLHNITDVTLSQQKLLQYSNESILINNTLKKILNRQNALLFVTERDEITYTNEQFMDYFGIKRMRDMRRRNLELYKYLDPSISSYDELFEKVNSKEEYITINNDTFILQASEIEATHKLFTLTKVTKLSQKIQFDSLTGAYKKSYFNQHLEKLITDQEEGVVVVLDLDNFKQVNDTYGHQIGDEVLKEFVTVIQDNIRSDDVFARWGGEEFLLLLKHTEIENALKKVEDLRSVLNGHTFKHVGHLTSSFGVALLDVKDDLHSVLQRADKALYEAKESGKNRVVFKKL
jgi:diguanylate cyclase (GGDEF)-like protein